MFLNRSSCVVRLGVAGLEVVVVVAVFTEVVESIHLLRGFSGWGTYVLF